MQRERYQDTPFASADENPSSYARIHRTVSRAPAVWNRVHIVGGSPLEDVIYEKAKDEAIAKVRERFLEKQMSPSSKLLQLGLISTIKLLKKAAWKEEQND